MWYAVNKVTINFNKHILIDLNKNWGLEYFWSCTWKQHLANLCIDNRFWLSCSSPLLLGTQGRRDSLPVHHVVRRRFSGPVVLPPLWRRHSCQENQYDGRRMSALPGLPLHRLEELYSQALASHDEHRSVTYKVQRASVLNAVMWDFLCIMHWNEYCVLSLLLWLPAVCGKVDPKDPCFFIIFVCWDFNSFTDHKLSQVTEWRCYCLFPVHLRAEYE